MIRIGADAVLLDIEGTLGSIAFVRTVLFPYAQENMDAYVAQHRGDPQVRAILDAAAHEAEVDPTDTAAILAALHEWSAQDRKVTALKSLQGLIWEEGYARHGVRGHVYDDAVAALRRFSAGSVGCYIYSSGSIAAQHLLFANSRAGDLRPLFGGFFDTTTGPKREPASYAAIAGDIGVAPARIAFFSDTIAELDAARSAGLQTVHVVREEDGTVAGDRHSTIATFDDVAVSRPSATRQ